MSTLAHIRYVYLLGIGGIGMSALARYFRAAGAVVAGYDKTPSELTQQLQHEGMDIHFEENTALIPAAFLDPSQKENVLVIYTPAVPAGHEELVVFREKGFTVKKRSEVLGLITRHSRSVAVAGTHGKTSTSTLIAHLLQHGGKAINAFLGGISTNYHSNLLLAEKAEVTVVEADEYDRSFLQLFPDVAVITSLDADHLDIYGTHEEMRNTYRQFALQVKEGGLLIHRKGLPLQAKVPVLTYAVGEKADVYTSDLRVEEGAFVYDVHSPQGVWKAMKLFFPGSHNVENSLAAIAVAIHLGLTEAQIRDGLASFAGVKRRFETVLKNERTVFIDDYAHHPAELKACITAARELYPGKKITGIFQPHLFTRTRDFADEFARSLELLDEIVLLDIYPAREKPIEGVSSAMLLEKLQHSAKQLWSKEEVPNRVKNLQPEVLLTLGAGDIDRLVEPIKKALQQQ